LIGVTHFFRDPDAFKALAEKALAGLVADKSDDHPIRAWVPACSSGEEAYSIAILLRECTEKLNRHVGIRIFATDIDKRTIDTARAGIYPASISADVSPNRLKRFFLSEENMYRTKKDTREMLVFAPQDIIKDPPFTKLDLICCRNLLIYFDAGLQKKLLPLFHYSLKPEGILLLGSSETIGGFSDLFTAVDKKWKIFRRKGSGPAARAAFAFSATPPLERIYEVQPKQSGEIDVVQLAEKSLAKHYAHPSVIIDEGGEILYFHGRTGKYLERAPGAARLSIYRMAREGLKLELPSAIHKAATGKKEVVRKGLAVKSNGNNGSIDWQPSCDWQPWLKIQMTP